MKLTIVIPAYNEEEAIGSIIERTLAERARITANSPVDEVEIIVVSDGSTDRTAEIARRYDEIGLIEFPANRGYGAAIKAGFRQGTGELVGFLDADGTCDPLFFATLASAVVEDGADVAIGSRLGPQSEMPRIRRVGNRIYALILSALSNRPVSDTASGMRVIRRTALDRLYPLPDGLHFTPAMSARVLMDERLTIVERPMSYQERVGDSKLSVLRDGVRFLHTIFEMTLMWRPARLFLSASVVCMSLMALLACYPMEMWLRAGRIAEDMIYRLLFCALLGGVGIAFLSAAVITDLLHRMWAGITAPRTFLFSVLDRAFSFRGLGLALVPAAPVLLWLVGGGVWTRLAHGYVDLHWSRIVVAGLVVYGLAQMLSTVLVANLIRFHAGRQATLADRGSRLDGTAAMSKDAVVERVVRPHPGAALSVSGH